MESSKSERLKLSESLGHVFLCQLSVTMTNHIRKSTYGDRFILAHSSADRTPCLSTPLCLGGEHIMLEAESSNFLMSWHGGRAEGGRDQS